MIERFTRAVEAASHSVTDEYTVSLSLGLARLGIDGNTPDELLEVADRRMYESKAQRKLVIRQKPPRGESLPSHEITRVVNE
jgi:GGDEF domain-containing protein